MAIIAGFTPWVDKDETIVDTGRVMEFGSLYIVWVTLVIILLVGSLILLVMKMHRSEGVQKTQLRYLMVALTISFGFVTFTNAIVPYVFGFHNLEPWGPIAGLWLTAITAYAIVKHRFLDITAVVARAVTYTLLLLAIVGIEAAFVTVAVKFLPESVDRVMVASAGAIIIVLGYDLLRGKLSQLTERVFFQGRYDTEDVLAALTHTMASVIEIKRLSRELLQILVGEMRISQGAFVLLAAGEASQVEAVNWPESNKLRSINWELILEGDKSQYVFEDLDDGDVKEMFRKQGITVAMPLKINREEIGMLLLGTKSSGDIYAERDLELLSIFAPQAAVAINNAKAYQEIQKFSKTLEKKVEERTTELEESQKEKLAKAKELLKIKDEFVFIATHDLATPVTAIRGFVQLLQESTVKLPSDVKFDINAISEATERLKTLVDDLLEVARGESGTIKVKLTKVDVNEVFRIAKEMVAQRAAERKISIKLDLDAKHNLIMADEHKLKEVIENLLTNAVKYNKDGGEVTIISKKAGENLEIEIKDTGIGIPEKEQSKVFTKFFRSESDEARMQNGTGLGLFVVQMLVNKMKGKIRFESKQNVGTTFYLTFQIA